MYSFDGVDGFIWFIIGVAGMGFGYLEEAARPRNGEDGDDEDDEEGRSDDSGE